MTRIVIVGGGSAGWMAAAYLLHTLKAAEITLVESSDVPTVGVGEATIPPLKRFMEELGLREADWMPACSATYKFAIQFADWYRPGDIYWHPFEGLPYFDPEHHLAQYWYRRFLDRPDADRLGFYDEAFVGIDVLRQNRVLKNPDGSDTYLGFAIRDGETAVNLSIPYAFHLDAGLFGAFLKDRVALPNGVRHIVDTIDAVEVAENGWIAGVTTRANGTVTGDLFVDCSGFRALLAGEALGGAYESWSDMLFCDRAVALRQPFAAADEPLAPFTRSAAQAAGWSWRIPLTSRHGTGYVYSSAFISDDEAEATLRAQLGEARVADVAANRVAFSVGTRRRHWIGNCVALGLAAGFVEPLESTALHLVQFGIERLAGIVARGGFNAAAVAGYNETLTRSMEEVRDFVIAHYALTQREDTPFWRAVRHETRIPDTLAARLADWQQKLPEHYSGGIFGETSWICVLLGMNALPLPHFYRRTPPAELDRHAAIIDKLGTVRHALAGHSADHRRFLTARLAASE